MSNKVPVNPQSKPKSSRLLVKTDIPAILAVILFAGLIFVFLIPGFERAMMDRKRFLLTDMTSSVFSLLEYYYSIEKDNPADSLVIRDQATKAIGSIRYGDSGKDYFWITDLHPRMIVHPYRPDLNGQDLNGYSDPTGKKVFVEFVRAASSTGEGFVDYMWQWNDDSTRIVPKLSYVRTFRPWGWVTGTGIYIDDVKEEIRRIELKALLISGLIVTIVIILLTVISQQTHRIEKKRKKAEEELHRSKELYRTLAEAASEGVLIWSQGGLQANKTLLSWINCSENDLSSKKASEIFVSPLFDENTDPEKLYDELTSRQYLEGALNTGNGRMINAHADISGIILGGAKAVLVAIRPVNIASFAVSGPQDSEIYNNITTGFFRITFGRKNRFLYSSAPLAEMLGFVSQNDLLAYSVDNFFDDRSEFRLVKKMLAKREPVNGLHVTLRKITGEKFPAVLNARVVENTGNEIWCEGSVEQLSSSHIGFEIPFSGLADLAASYVMGSPVASIMLQPVTCDESMPLSEVIRTLTGNRTEYALVVSNEKKPLGTVSVQSVAEHLAAGIPSSTEVYRCMDSPPLTVDPAMSVAGALRKLHQTGSGCLVVLSPEGKAPGMITHKSVLKAFFSSSGLITKQIAGAQSPAALRDEYLRARELAVSMIMGKADPWSVTLLLTSVHDSVCCRAIDLALNDSGTAPCRFAFFVTGSAGRRELTLATDQDNAIIYEDPASEREEKQFHEYFTGLGKKINNILETAGYNLCKGNNMAGNPRWCQPSSRWKEYFSRWINSPGPEELLEVSIFFDFRFCFGDAALTDNLRDYINNNLRTNDIYFHHMAEAWMGFSPHAENIKGGKTDLKKLLMPLTGIVRLYSLRNSLSDLSTPLRLIRLMDQSPAGRGILREALRAWKELTSIRLLNQALLLANEDSPSNIADITAAGESYVFIVSKSAGAIRDLLLKAANDFYTRSI